MMRAPENSDVRIRAVVWNICGASFDAAAAAVAMLLDGCGTDAVDLVAFGLVEIIDLSAINCVRESFGEGSSELLRRAAGWRALVAETLGAGFALVAERTLVGLALYVFARIVPGNGGEADSADDADPVAPLPAPRWTVSSASTAEVRTGFGAGLLGNKGVVIASLALSAAGDAAGTTATRTICFAHAHMAASLGSLPKRNAEFRRMIDAKVFASDADLAVAVAKVSDANILDAAGCEEDDEVVPNFSCEVCSEKSVADATSPSPTSPIPHPQPLVMAPALTPALGSWPTPVAVDMAVNHTASRPSLRPHDNDACVLDWKFASDGAIHQALRLNVGCMASAASAPVAPSSHIGLVSPSTGNKRKATTSALAFFGSKLSGAKEKAAIGAKAAFGSVQRSKSAVAAATATMMAHVQSGGDGPRAMTRMPSAMLDKAKERASQAAVVGARRAAAAFSTSGPPPTIGILDHELVIFMGDLNYRLHHPPLADGSTAAASSDDEVADNVMEVTDDDRTSHVSGPKDRLKSIIAADLAAIAAGNLDALVARDQLLASRDAGQAFVGFDEAPINFPPTYRYLKGTSAYCHKRRPAWCDRVLWHLRGGGGGVACTRYSAAGDVALSDHRPVVADLVWSPPAPVAAAPPRVDADGVSLRRAAPLREAAAGSSRGDDAAVGYAAAARSRGACPWGMLLSPRLAPAKPPEAVPPEAVPPELE